MFKRAVLMSLFATSLIAVPQAAGAAARGPDCYLNCAWITTYDAWGNPVGGYWICPGEEMECVS